MKKDPSTALAIHYGSNHGSISASATVELADGSKERFFGYGKTKVTAASSLRQKIREANDRAKYGMDAKAGNITLEEAARDYIEEKRTAYNDDKGRAVRDETILRDCQTLNALILTSPIAQKKLKHITVTDLEEYRKFLNNAVYDSVKSTKPHEPKPKHYSASQKNRAVSLVKNTLDKYYLYSPEKTPTGVLKRFRETHVPKTEKDVLTRDEMNAFLDLCSQRRENPVCRLDPTYADAFATAMQTGLRLGEVIGLQARDYDTDKGCVYVRRTGQYEDGRAKTALSLDSVYLVPDVIEIMERRTAGLDANALVFPNTVGRILSKSDMNTKFRQWLKELCIDKDISPGNGSRATCASSMYDKGLTADAVRVQLRHSNVRTSQQYYIAVSDNLKQSIRDMMAQKV